MFAVAHSDTTPDSKVHGANMGPIWGRQDPGGPHVGPMNFAIWDVLHCAYFNFYWVSYRNYNTTDKKSWVDVEIKAGIEAGAGVAMDH